MRGMLVKNTTRLECLTMGDRERLNTITRRAESIASGEEQIQPGRAFADITALLIMIGGEYATRARDL